MATPQKPKFLYEEVSISFGCTDGKKALWVLHS